MLNSVPWWVWVIGGLFILRYLYVHTSPHGMVSRVIPMACRRCTASSSGLHVICNCGRESPHYESWQFLARRKWRQEHREKMQRK